MMFHMLHKEMRSGLQTAGSPRVRFRCPVQHRGNLHVLRCEELLERFLRCHLQCLHLQSVSGLEQR